MYLLVSLSYVKGERTEPNYFKALIKDRYSDIREVTIEGKGQGTVSLIKETIAIRDKSNKEFDRVWAVFLIRMTLMISMTPYSLQKRIIFFAHGLMSHSNFGIIYIFQYLDTGISRSQYIEKIEREIQNRTNDSNYRYKKEITGNFRHITTYRR